MKIKVLFEDFWVRANHAKIALDDYRKELMKYHAKNKEKSR